ncbi:MAG: T9SS type A sorting domain-containing protein, partial [Bacteroidia bacterium]|nr:T9SS type A sorting domain-containing protein [Bacteroidia bacterium]
RIMLPPGSPYNLTLTALDAQNDNIVFTSFGEPYMLANNPASFSSAAPFPGISSGTFTWTPNASHARLAPYIISFRVSDGMLTTDETLIIEVGTFTSIEEDNTHNIGNSYPNPTTNILIVPFELQNASTVQFELFDILGNKIADDVIKQYASGKHNEKFSMDLPSGIYFMQITVDGKTMESKKITIK